MSFEFAVLRWKITDTIVLSSVKYVIVGFATFGLDFVLNWFLIKVVGMNYLIVGYLIAPLVLAFNFYTHKHWSFKDMRTEQSRTHRQIVRYLILVAFNSIANMGLMYLFYGVLELPLFLTRVLCTGVGIMWTFPINRLWIYKP
ncbi:MAG: GtrA family protein [Candidatus Dojkabacteria bacterium]|nr:GtrA family protein [Candidatus Dojkabacteria bacterium]